MGANGGSMFAENGAYPRVTDVQQLTSMDYARNNNFDKTKTYPFAEAGYHAYNTFVCAHELLYGTNYINEPDNLFSSGTSSSDRCDNEATWAKYGGVRIKTGDGEWKYLNWSTTPNWIYKDANGATIGSHMSAWLNKEAPKWRANEAQMALSLAAETGIAENTEFEFYGKTYWYVTPPKAKGLVDGYMNARVYCKMISEWQGYDAVGNPQTYTIEAVLRQGVMDGVSTAGDIFHYRGGGYEMVATNHCTETNGQNGVNDMDVYLMTDQRQWHSDKTYQKPNLGAFVFENAYDHVVHIEKITSGYMKQRYAPSCVIKTGGVGRTTGVCAYSENSNWYSSQPDLRVRVAVRFGGAAKHGACAARYVTATHACPTALWSHGGSAQCLFSKRR